MNFLKSVSSYLRELSIGMIVLWSYLFWYLFFLIRYFSLDWTLWGVSLFMSLVVGIALNLNAFGTFNNMASADKWKIFRFFFIPFCVSSYPQLIQGHGFILILSPDVWENIFALIPIILLIGLFLLSKKKCT